MANNRGLPWPAAAIASSNARWKETLAVIPSILTQAQDIGATWEGRGGSIDLRRTNCV